MNLNRRQFTIGAAAMFAGAALPYSVRSEDRVKVRFATDWLPQGAHGGYYQALADGTYEKMGLDVEIVSGGPDKDTRPMLASGDVEFLMSGNLLLPFDDISKGLPFKVVAAHFQKDPQVLIAHKGVFKDFAELTKAPKVLLSEHGATSYGKWMLKAKGFRAEQITPYDYSMKRFFEDTQMIQEGYAVSEPYEALAANVEIDSWLLADEGWDTYSCMVQTRDELLVERPELVQKFVDASTIGWYNYLYGDAAPGMDAIIAANPEQSTARLAWENEALRSLGIVDSGETLSLGIGAMNADRIKAFYDLCVGAGVIEAGSVDLAAVADFSYVNKSVGLELRKG